ncbi:MAG: hypothetical protein IJ509_01880 [Bacilli bacterium]|nr:hypothetical protein [Bacilli bacterium]
MTLETFFTQNDIDEIYTMTIIYSILKYQSLPEKWQQEFLPKYEHAKSLLTERNIKLSIIESANLDQIKLQLENYQVIYNSNIELNRNVINQIGPIIAKTIITEIKTKDTEIDRISYLVDFLTNYMTYSKTYDKYCLSLSTIDGFNFDFQNNIPVDNSINGLLVMGQGVCDDISTILQFLGELLDLKIAKISCHCQGIFHSLNTITLSDGNTYLIDATKLITKSKSKQDCFLVSADVINKNNEYIFKEDIVPTKTYIKPISNYHQEAIQLIDKLNAIKPKIEDLNDNKQSRTK